MFELPKLKFKRNELEPYISERTIEFHHSAHHKGYIDKTNDLIYNTPFQNQSLLEIVNQTQLKGDHDALFNSAAQSWNHSFYWNSLMPDGGGYPPSDIAEMIEKEFGAFQTFKSQFISTATDHFGSGWIWLTINKEAKLELTPTSNADNPTLYGLTPILTCDLWEHAFYLDYQDRKIDYVTSFLDHLANWSFAGRCVRRGEY